MPTTWPDTSYPARTYPDRYWPIWGPTTPVYDRYQAAAYLQMTPSANVNANPTPTADIWVK